VIITAVDYQILGIQDTIVQSLGLLPFWHYKLNSSYIY